MDIGAVIAWKYPNARSGVDYSIVFDVKTGTQTIEFWAVPGAPQPTTTDLQNWWISALQAQKIAQLKSACQQTILAGFTSSCLGAAHQYDFDYQAQMNLTAQYTMLMNDSTITSVMWKTKDAGPLSHTRAQFIQLCKDADNWKWTNVQRYWNLVAQVQAATTEAQINAITW
jgi:hypothetical protein